VVVLIFGIVTVAVDGSDADPATLAKLARFGDILHSASNTSELRFVLGPVRKMIPLVLVPPVGAIEVFFHILEPVSEAASVMVRVAPVPDSDGVTIGEMVSREMAIVCGVWRYYQQYLL